MFIIFVSQVNYLTLLESHLKYYQLIEYLISLNKIVSKNVTINYQTTTNDSSKNILHFSIFNLKTVQCLCISKCIKKKQLVYSWFYEVKVLLSKKESCSRFYLFVLKLMILFIKWCIFYRKKGNRSD